MNKILECFSEVAKGLSKRLVRKGLVVIIKETESSSPKAEFALIIRNGKTSKR
jgi:hypothetical protein